MTKNKNNLFMITIGLVIFSIIHPLYAKNLSIPFSINEIAGITSTNIPVTLAQPLLKGDVRSQDTLKVLASDSSELTTQVDKKSFYPDGSLKHGIISFILPELSANQTKTFTLTTGSAQTITSDSSLLTDILSNPFDLTISIDENNILYQSSLKQSLQQTPSLWLNGAICTEWQVTGEFKNNQNTSHPNLTPIFYLRAYKDSDIIRVSVIIENNFTYQPTPQNYVYDLNITTNNSSLFSQSGLTHYHHARLRKVFYLDISTQPVDVTDRMNGCHIAHNIRYLMQTRMVPPYDPSLINNLSESKIADLVTAWNQQNQLMGKGLVSHYLNSASKGPLPQWAAAYLLTMNPDLQKITSGHGELAGSFSIHYRDKQTHLPVSIIDYPHCSTNTRLFDLYNPETEQYEHPTKCTEGYDCTNNLRFTFDSLAYLPYLLTGDYYFLEELHFRANYCLIQQNPGYREFEKGLIKGISYKSDQAWALRTLNFTALITPDTHPMKDYFNDILNNNINYLNEKTAVYANNPLGWLIISKGDNNQLLITTGDDDYYTWSAGLLAASGFTEANPFYQWKSKFVVSRMNNPSYCWIFSALPKIVVGLDYNDFDSSFSSMDESWYPTLAFQYGDISATSLQSMTCNSPEMMTILNLSVDEMPSVYDPPTDDYPARMQIALASAVDAGITGSVQAWERFIHRNFQPDYSSEARPNFAIVPYSLYYARAGILHTSLNPIPFMIEGDMGYSIGFSLQSPPDQPVSIAFVPDDQIAITPASITFTAADFNVKQFIQISPLNDTSPENFDQGTIQVEISSDDASYSNLTFQDLHYNLYDDDVLQNLSFSQTIIDFGDFQKGAADSRNITLSNNSQTPVSIQSIMLSGTAFTINHDCTKQLLPDETCLIDVSYLSTEIGQNEASIIISSTTEPSTYTIELRAQSNQRILQVGPDKMFQWVRSAALAAEDYDIIEIDAGVYLRDVATWTANHLTIRGIGGRAHLNAVDHNEGGKAIWVVQGNDTRIENIEFSHCKVNDGNGAGIRLEGNNCIIRNCYFHHNEMGILTSINLYDCELLIDRCEFAYQGSGNKTTGRGIDHNIYINVMKKFTIQYSYIHHATIGHNIKTRAPENHILYNRIMDESIGRSSYLIDFAQGGKSIVKGNVFHLGRCSENASMISYAGELPFHVQKDLYVVNNTFVSDYDDSAVGIYIRNQTNTLVIANNLFVGNGDLWTERENGLVQSLDNTTNVVVSDIDSMHFRNPQHFDFHLTSASAAAIDAGSLINNYQGMDLIPIDEYSHPISSAIRLTDTTIDAGAFEYTNAFISVNPGNDIPEIISNMQSDTYTLTINKAPSAQVSITLCSESPDLNISPTQITFAAGETGVTKVIQLSGLSAINATTAWIAHKVRSDDPIFDHLSLPEIKIQIQPDPSAMGLYITENAIDFSAYKQTDPPVIQHIAIANHLQNLQSDILLTIEGEAYSLSHNCPTELASNGYCHADITYTPGHPGLYTGTLHVETSLTHQKIPLSGRSVSKESVIYVGPGRKYKSPRDASVIAQKGDLIEIDAGVYENNVAMWKTDNLTIRGVGGMAHLKIIDGAISAEGKAIWIVHGDNYTIENIEMSGCKVPDMNGAGIRAEGVNLRVKNCYFHHNQMGFLSSTFIWGCTIIIENCEFAYNRIDDGHNHNIYINVIDRFILKNSYSHHASIGHTVKSRAKENLILNNRLMDEHSGDSSYLIDFPYGGNNMVIGNILHQGVNARNPAMIEQGGEDANNNEQQGLIVAYNTFVNERPGESHCLKIYDRMDSLLFENNLVVGVADLIPSSDMPIAATVTVANNITDTTSSFVNADLFDYRLKSTSPAINQGHKNSHMPYFQYVHPEMYSKRIYDDHPDVGAYEFQPDIIFQTVDNFICITEGTAGYCNFIALTVAPLSPVTVQFSSALTDVQIQPASLVFTPLNYSLSQQICIAAIETDIANNQRTGHLTIEIQSDDFRYNHLQPAHQSIIIKDNDPIMILSDHELDFGNQLIAEQSLSKTITVANSGFGNLTIHSFAFDTSVVAVTHNCDTLNVHDSCQFNLSIIRFPVNITLRIIVNKANYRQKAFA